MEAASDSAPVSGEVGLSDGRAPEGGGDAIKPSLSFEASSDCNVGRLGVDLDWKPAGT